MNRLDIKKAEERSNVLRETSEELNRDSLALRSESLRLRESSRKLAEEVKKNTRPKKAARSAGGQKPLKEQIAIGN